MSLINEEFTALKNQMSGQMNDLTDIERLLENPLVMVSALAFEDDASSGSSMNSKGK